MFKQRFRMTNLAYFIQSMFPGIDASMHGQPMCKQLPELPEKSSPFGYSAGRNVASFRLKGN